MIRLFSDEYLMKVRNTIQQIPYSFYVKYVTGVLLIWINLEYPTINALSAGILQSQLFRYYLLKSLPLAIMKKSGIELEFGFRKGRDKER